ncbi:MAG: hypothetical protein O3A88_03820 [Proteobacteria bacterium]|nr:hypothetical protein [Pseudomonadota bacterium]
MNKTGDDLYGYLQEILNKIAQQYHVIGRSFDPPFHISHGSSFRIRHPELSDSLLRFLKGVKLVSTLNGALVLLRNGYVHEVAALCRMADDFCNEIVFMLRPESEGLIQA